ncbi:MAG: hypothetical protein J0L75_04255 [Spirochaetes bacterium]|nr:hypothetical protein [Spirochaetota bacterium]
MPKKTTKKKPIAYIPWTDADVQTMKIMMKKGRESTEVAAALKRTTTAVRFKAFKLGLSFHQRGGSTAAWRKKYGKAAPKTPLSK